MPTCRCRAEAEMPKTRAVTDRRLFHKRLGAERLGDQGVGEKFGFEGAG